MPGHRQNRSAGIIALALFFAFGAVASGLTIFLLLFPGSGIEPLWQLNPKAHQGFAGMGHWGVLLMLVVCVACLTASIGLWRRTTWGLWTAVVILVFNLLGDIANAAFAHEYRSLIGVLIGGIMLVYLLRHRYVFGA